MPHAVFQSPKRSRSRKTVKVTVWVKPIVKAELQRRAEREGLSLSATGAAFLEKAMQASVDMQYGTLLEPIIERTITKHLQARDNRLAILLVRSLFASEQTRSLVTNILGRQPGVSQPVLEHILNGSSSVAKRNITRLTPQLKAIIVEVEQWMQEAVLHE